MCCVPDPDAKLLLKYPEAAYLMGIGETLLREEVKGERIFPVRFGMRVVRFPIEEIYRWKDELIRAEAAKRELAKQERS